MHIPFWAWAVLAVGVLVVAARLAARAWRAGVRKEFVAYLRERAPDIELLEVREYELSVKVGDHPCAMRLDRLYEECGRVPNQRAARQPLFDVMVRSAREWPGERVITPERDRPRLRPRLVHEAKLAAMKAETGDRLVALPFGVPGLFVVLVLDAEASVAYVVDEILASLELTPEEALALARDNLAASSPRPLVRTALQEGSLQVMKSGDTYDAARLLLVPGCLEDGEEVAAAVPDRDTLLVTRVPDDGDWSKLRKLARAAAGEPLWREPLRVTRVGISSVG